MTFSTLGHMNASPTFSDLPQELVDRVIDLLRNDAAALRTCSLVGRSTRPRAQSHIYRSVCLTPSRCVTYNALAKQSPHLATAVHHLCVTQSVYKLIGRKSHSHLPGYEQVLGPQDARRPHLFPAVTTLKLDFLDPVSLSPSLLSLICDLRRVETLRLHSCRFTTLDGAAELICHFPRLKSLTACDIFTQNTFDPRVRESPAPHMIEGPASTTVRPALEELRLYPTSFLGEISSISLTKWVFEQGMYDRLSSLQIAVSRRAEVAVLSACLRQLGPRLQHLDLSLEQLDHGASLGDPLTLSSNTGLRTLCFGGLKLHADTESERPKPSLAWVPRVLSELPSPVLESVRFQIRGGGALPTDLGTLDWVAVNDILCGQQFGSLRQVNIELQRGSSIEDVFWTYVKERMSELHLRGIVTHSYVKV